MYVLVENNEVVKKGLPKTGQLSDGRWVSNYHLLPEETLLAEGWLPLIDNIPAYNSETHRPVRTGFDIYPDRVEAVYTLEEILPPQITEEELQDRAVKKIIKKNVNDQIANGEISGSEVYEYESFIDEWKAGIAYSAGNIVKYNEKLYKVLQAHTSQSDWTPERAVSLFAVYTTGISDWVQPTGAHDCYNAGDMVSYKGKTYKSLVDGNVRNPEEYEGRLWELQE